MEHDVWHKMWSEGRINFHQPHGNAGLVEYFPRLNLAPNNRVFVPLCGKTRDIAWLLDQGFQVVGIELSQMAIEQLFAELGQTPTITPTGPLTRYEIEHLTIFVGDVFDLTAEHLGPVDAIYDRAALVALPEDLRTRYATLLMDITARAPQLLMSFAYDQSAMSGPPFSIPETTIRALYGISYDINHLSAAPLPGGGFKGTIPATDHIWLLH